VEAEESTNMAPSLALPLPLFILIILCLQIQTLAAVAAASSNNEQVTKNSHHDHIISPNDEEEEQVSAPVNPTFIYHPDGLVMTYSLFSPQRAKDPACTFTHNIVIAQNDDVDLLAKYLCYKYFMGPIDLDDDSVSATESEMNDKGESEGSTKSQCLSFYAKYLTRELLKQREYAKRHDLEKNQELLEVRKHVIHIVKLIYFGGNI
jgi:hypothetical protein